MDARNLLAPLKALASHGPTSGVIKRLGRTKRRPFGVAVFLTSILAGSLMGIPQAQASGWVVSEHSCVVFDSFMGNEAVFCADLLTEVVLSDTLVEARLEAVCQNATTKVPVQCADVNFSTLETYTTNADWRQGETHVCGHSAGNCSMTGRNYFTLTPAVVVDGSKGCQDAEGIIWSGSQIELPGGSGHWATLTTGLGSGPDALYC